MMTNPIDALVDAVAERLASHMDARLRALTVRTDEAEPLVGATDVARALGVSVVTVARLVKAGMPHHYVGSARRFYVSEARAWNDARGRVSAEGERKAKTGRAASPIPGVTRAKRAG